MKSIYINDPLAVHFVNKRIAFDENRNKIYPVDVNDFNFRVTYSLEEPVNIGLQNYILDSWKKNKKIFRFLNRVSFRHPDYPVIIDISIVKFSDKKQNPNNKWEEMIKTYNIDESNVFQNNEVYEIEIEVDNKKVGAGTKFNSPELILDALKKVIKFVLSGLQGTNYPISYPEQKEVLSTYMKLIWKDKYDPIKRVENKNFIGPNSITLQLINICEKSENSNDTNIREDFVVTDKADGHRHLLIVNETGKIYLINTSMEVIFTGAKTENKDCFNTILDGELIEHDKNGNYILQIQK